MEETKQREENNQQQQPKPAAANFRWVKTKADIPDIYCNYLAVSWTLYDVRFVLGQLVPNEPASLEFVADERATVTVAWPEVKVLRDMLANLVAKYEETNGEIKQLKLPLAT